MKKLKKLLSIALCSIMIFSLAACQKSEPAANDDVNTGTPATNLSEEEAMKLEPAYEKGISYWYDGGNCTASPYLAEKLGYFEEAGIKVEHFKGTNIKEALGTNAAQIGVSHIASMMVPITNNVNYTFVAGTIVGCQSLVVLADSEYKTTADLVGKKVSAPNGIGNSSYNIGARFFDRDGIDPLKDIDFIQVEASACIGAMQSGELDAAVMSDTFTYDMVKDGTLRIIRSITYDDDFTNEPCCVLCMNNDFRKENPIMAKKIVECVKKADIWAGKNAEEAVKMLLDDEMMTGAFEKNLELWNTLQWGVCTDEFTEKALKVLVEDYIRIGLITSMDDPEKVFDMVWNPLAPETK